jgi:catechol 2,3-dioxygenase-like lactoylglutathione lyase family enzyme
VRGCAALLLPAVVLAFAAAGCGGDGDGEAGDGAERLRPRISAEHPVTSPPALEAGIWERSEAADAPLLGAAAEGTVESADGAGADGVVPLLPASDLDASVAFYTDLLGFETVAAAATGSASGRVELVRGGVRLVLVEAWRLARLAAAGDEAEGTAAGGEENDAEAQAEDGGAAAENGAPETAGQGEGSVSAPPARAVLRIPVDDLDAVAGRLEEAGIASAERTDNGQRGLAVRDPDGTPLLVVAAAGSAAGDP